MAQSYTIISPTQGISARTYKTVRSLKSWAKHYLETTAVPADLVLVQRKDHTFGFMRFTSPVFTAALSDKVTNFWFAHELKYE